MLINYYFYNVFILKVYYTHYNIILYTQYYKTFVVISLINYNLSDYILLIYIKCQLKESWEK